jgi:hypothetical protein
MAAPFALGAALMLPAVVLVALYRLSVAEQGADTF